jgi:hypothetical protein
MFDEGSINGLVWQEQNFGMTIDVVYCRWMKSFTQTISGR